MRFIFLVLWPLALSAGEAKVVQGLPAQQIYSAFLSHEYYANAPTERLSRSYKSEGGLSCLATCPWDSDCNFQCSLKASTIGHAALWNTIRARVRVGESINGITNYYKETGALSCLAQIWGADGRFTCWFN